MHSDQLPYRQLHDEMLDYEGEALFDDLLAPWLRAQDGERRWLDEMRTRRGDPVPAVRQEESWRLYALSRIIQLLELSLASPRLEERWAVAPVSRDEFARFMDALGLQAVERAGFHPFYHEIVTVDQAADEDAAPEIVEVLWPGYTLGPLLISRGGVRIRAGRRQVVKEIAEGSTLYWAYARNNRRAEDLSSGWGGNSQWRTEFRRDYALDGALHYNVDARDPGPGAGIDLDAAERAELLRHRCFVTRTRPSDDLWPYGLRLVEPT
ncbi:MAG TPA: hypothetical protein VF006_10700 [Longimicrobium sp.]